MITHMIYCTTSYDYPHDLSNPSLFIARQVMITHMI